MVKNRVKWPHKYVLSSLNKERVSYDQLSVTQWVAGFGHTTREESDPEVRQYMLDYMISLMDDANDFSWISAKASHAVLLCRMEQGKIKSYSDVMAIDRIRRANAQKHVATSVASSPQNSKTTKSMPCTYINQGTCLQKRSHETRGGGSPISISVHLVLLQQVKLFHMLRLIVKVSTKVRQKTSKIGIFVNNNCNVTQINNQLLATRDT